jgi:hypothetical protein
MKGHRLRPLSLVPTLLACTAGCLPELWPEANGAAPKQGAVLIVKAEGLDTAQETLHARLATRPPFEVAVGGTLRLRIEGVVMPGHIHWTSSDTSVAALRADFPFTDELVVGKKLGSVTVSLEVDGQRDSITVTVRPEPRSP